MGDWVIGALERWVYDLVEARSAERTWRLGDGVTWGLGDLVIARWGLPVGRMRERKVVPICGKGLGDLGMGRGQRSAVRGQTAASGGKIKKLTYNTHNLSDGHVRGNL